MPNSLPFFEESELLATIINDKGEIIEVSTFDNLTSYSFDSDFFEPADAGTFVIEYDRNEPYKKNGSPKILRLEDIQVGSQFNVDINGIPQFQGYISDATLDRDVNGGQRLTLHCHDILHKIKESILPFNTKFTKDTTLKQALEEIFSPFGISKIITDDSANLSIASGGKVGVKIKGKTPRGRQKSLQNSINRILKPQKGEGVLEFAKKLCDMYGMNIKLVPGTRDLLVSAPIYKRDSEILYKLNLINNDPESNVQNYSHQFKTNACPSAIIGECVDTGKGSSKVIYVSELFGYDLSKGFKANNFNSSVKKKIEPLLTNKKGYLVIDPNVDFVNNLPPNILSLISSRNLAQVMEYQSHSARNQEQLIFEVSRKMFDYHNDVFTFNYTVKGHEDFTSRSIWNCNNLVKVFQDLNGQKISSDFWIKRRTFTKSASEGAKTRLELKLPFTYDFDIED